MTNRSYLRFGVVTAFSLAVWFGSNASPAAAQSPEAFYRDKLVTMYVGYAAGGGYDLYARLLARHLGKHLVGKPNVILRNQPGAGSFRLANELYTVLPKDGSALGMIGESLVISQLLDDPAAKFVTSDFNWIGRMVDTDPVLVTRPGATASIQEAMSKEVAVGVPGAGSATALMVTAVNGLLGTKFKIISGYDGSASIRLALERGEVEGSASTLWRIDRNWIRANNLNVIYQASIEPASDLPGVPTLIQVARNEDERKLLTFYSSFTTIGKAVLTPPKVPADRLAALRAAFDAAMKDADLISEAKKANMDLNVLSGEKLSALVNDVTSIEKQLLERAKKISGK